MGEPKRHHVVPAFFLRRFARDGVVELIPRDDLSRVIPAGVENALVEKHFYSVDTDTGRDATVEKMFSSLVEGPASRALRRVVDEGKSMRLAGLRGAISTFMAFQFVRGMAARQAQVEFFKANARKVASLLTPSILQAELARQGEPVSDDEARDIVKFAQSGDYDVGVSSEAAAHLPAALKTALEIVPLLFNRSWVLLEFDLPMLLTGDEPVGLIGESLSPGEAMGVYHASEVVFPVDPRHALVLVRTDKPCEEGRDVGTRRMANIINRHVAFSCHRFIVRHPGTDPLKGVSLPKAASPVVVRGDYVIIQPHVSARGRKAWLRKRWPGRTR
jgi:hypothetical protein